MQDVGAGWVAAFNIFQLLDQMNTEDQNQRPVNPVTRTMEIKGEIRFVNVSFTYPSRNKPVFEKLNLVIEAGKKVALVGSSGCGKDIISSELTLINRKIHDNSAAITILRTMQR